MIRNLEKRISASSLLSVRERQVAQMVLGKRLSLRESARLLGVSMGSVRTYLERVYRKLGL